jgi:mRNA interferase MazF
MTFMPSFSRHNLILVRYPFSNLSSSKVRPAVVVNGPHISQDIIVVPITSRLAGLLPGEFMLAEWRAAGLNIPSAFMMACTPPRDQPIEPQRRQRLETARA